MCDPDQIDMMDEEELRDELRKALVRNYALEDALQKYIRAGCDELAEMII